MEIRKGEGYLIGGRKFSGGSQKWVKRIRVRKSCESAGIFMKNLTIKSGFV